MAFFPDVTRGDKFKPDALLSNNVRHIVNAMNGFSAKPLFATGGMIRRCGSPGCPVPATVWLSRMKSR